MQRPAYCHCMRAAWGAWGPWNRFCRPLALIPTPATPRQQVLLWRGGGAFAASVFYLLSAFSAEEFFINSIVFSTNIRKIIDSNFCNS